MKAVSVLEHFSDHDSIHQKLKKNTTSVRSYPNSADDGLRYIVQPCLLFTTPAFLRHPLFSPVPTFFFLRRCQILFSISSLVRPVARDLGSDTAFKEMLCDAGELADEIDIPAYFELTQPRHTVRRRNVNFDNEARDDPIEDPTLKNKAAVFFHIR
ncbi:uncharacterized protein TNCV_3216991 [Trichonephila clavipes]|nr:uncharacterized protein TNCV_3216991 [Trichonephila clavipes]